MAFTSSSQEMEQALLLQPLSRHGAHKPGTVVVETAKEPLASQAKWQVGV